MIGNQVRNLAINLLALLYLISQNLSALSFTNLLQYYRLFSIWEVAETVIAL